MLKLIPSCRLAHVDALPRLCDGKQCTRIAKRENGKSGETVPEAKSLSPKLHAARRQEYAGASPCGLLLLNAKNAMYR
jgi:hypothetical protein